MVEGARLESVYTATYRGFESLPLRHLDKNVSPAEAFLSRGRACGDDGGSPVKRHVGVNRRLVGAQTGEVVLMQLCHGRERPCFYRSLQ